MRQWKADVRVPPAAPAQQVRANEYLRERNAERVKKLLREGVTDEETLVEALGDWETALAGDDRFPIVFLGLVLTLDCCFLPRCLYCNQIWLPRRLTLDEWKALLREAAEPIPPYVYLTGGEPLVLGTEVWGDDGLVAFATELGSAVNINTNAVLITPHVALQLVKVGLAKLHISLDTTDPQVQGELLQGSERMNAVLRGIFNIQIAREVLGANHPHIHINCVLTARNLFQFPDLLRYLLEIRRVRSPDFEGKVTDIHYQAEVHGDEGNTVLIKVAVDKGKLVDEKDLPLAIRPGAGVSAKVVCENMPVGYVFLCDAIGYFQKNIAFRFF